MDIGAANWSEDDTANTTAAPDGAPEGMAPSGVNNVLRAHQGAVKRWYDWSIPRTTGGTATAYMLSYSVAPGALADGMTHLAEFHAGNGAAPTLNVNGLGAIPIHYCSAGAWRLIPPGLLGANEICRVAYHSSSGAYRILHRADTTGDWIPTGRSTARGGTILGYGQAVGRTAYAGLFAAYGTTYGAGDGSTTFNLPDLRGRAVAGKSDMGGSDAGNLAGGGVLGAALGSQTNTAATTVSGSTFGSISVGGSIGTATGGTAVFADGGGGPATGYDHGHAFSGGFTSGSLGVSGGGTSAAFGIVQPTRVGTYLICL